MSKASTGRIRTVSSSAPGSKDRIAPAASTAADAPAVHLSAAFPGDLSCSVIFAVLADHGTYGSNASLSHALNVVAKSSRKFDAIFEVGDLLYPHGPGPNEAGDFFRMWKSRFASGPYLSGTPHFIALGNHCVSGEGSRDTLLGLTTSPLNSGGEWQMRGHPSDPPSTFYTLYLPLFAPQQQQQQQQKAASAPPAPSSKAAVAPLNKSHAAAAAAAAENVEKQRLSEQENEASGAEMPASSAQPAAAAAAADSSYCSFSSRPRKVIGLVHFNMVETNIASSQTLRRNPVISSEWGPQMVWLNSVLSAQKKDQMNDAQRAREGSGGCPASLQLPPTLFKLVFGHHPCYCSGVGHNSQAMVLRTAIGKAPAAQGSLRCTRTGLGLEHVLVNGEADVYVAGHEHVSSMALRRGNVLHVTTGAASEHEVYGGIHHKNNRHPFEYESWREKAFLVGCVWADPATRTVKLTLSFIAVENPYPGAILHTKTIDSKFSQ